MNFRILMKKLTRRLPVVKLLPSQDFCVTLYRVQFNYDFMQLRARHADRTVLRDKSVRGGRSGRWVARIYLEVVQINR